MDNIVMLIIGLVLCITGAINFCGNISTIHSYNRSKIKEDDIPKYGKVVGLGTIIIGLGIIAAFCTMTAGKEAAVPYIITPSIIIGIGIILYGQFKYNKGIF